MHLTKRVDALERELRNQTIHGSPKTRRSGARTFSFYWYRRAKHLAVKVHPADPRDPVLEALVKRLGATRVCPVCGDAFTRRGRSLYCCPAHAARARKRRWLKKQRQEQIARRQVRTEVARLRRSKPGRIGAVVSAFNYGANGPERDGR